MINLKTKLKSVIKKCLNEDLDVKSVNFHQENASKALEQYIKLNPRSVSEYKSIGERKDKQDFYPAAKKIAVGFDLLYRDLEEIGTNSKYNLTEHRSIRSGIPLRSKPFPMCEEYVMRLLLSKYLYRYPSVTDRSLGCQNVINYLIREGFKAEKSENYDGLGVENIVFAYSTTHAYGMIIKTICRPEDVVIMTGPNYGLFTVETEKINAHVEILDLKKEDDWYVNPKSLEKKIDEINKNLKEKFEGKLDYIPKVVAFFNMNPHNPTGRVMNSKNIDLLKSIGDICLEKGVFVIDDLIYRDLTYDQNDLAIPMASMPKYFNNTISFLGLSKSYGLASVRAGFIVAPAPICSGICDIISSDMGSISLLQTQVVAGAFNGTNRRYKIAKKYFKPLIKRYIYHLNLLQALIDGIDSINSLKCKKRIIKDINKYTKNKNLQNKLLKGIPGVELRKDVYPDSGFFAIADFTQLKGKKYNGETINNDADFLKFLYKETGIKCIAGLNISWPYEDEIIIRVGFSLDINDLILNFELIGKAVEGLE